MELKSTLKELLVQNKMTVTELAAETHLPESSIRTWLRGASPRSLDDIRTVATFFKVSPMYLLWRETEHCGVQIEGIPLEEVFKGWVLIDIKRPISIPKKTSDKKNKS